MNASQFVTNTMRICTRDASNVDYDATVPVRPRWNNPQKMYSDAEFCAPTEKDVPWSMDDSNIADAGKKIVLFAQQQQQYHKADFHLCLCT